MISKMLFDACRLDGRHAPLKCDPVTAALVGASIINGMINSASQSSTNAQQIQLARDQMAQQREENQLNRDWSEKMWNAQNVYNTPSAMMQRYSEAGLNPFLVDESSTGIGSAGAPSSPSMVSQGGVPNLTAPRFDMPESSMYLSAQKVDADAANQRAQATKTVIDAARELYNIGGVDAAEQFLNENLPTGSDVRNSPAVQQFKVEQAQRELEMELFDFQSQLEQRYGAQKAERALEIMQNESFKLMSEVDKLDMDTVLDIYKMDEILSQMARNYAEAANLDADTQTIYESRQAIVDSLTFRADMDYYEREEMLSEFENTEGVRLFKRTPEAKRKRLEAETTMDERFNKRLKAVRSFREALGLSTSVGFHGVQGSYSSNNRSTINSVPHNSSTYTGNWTSPTGHTLKRTDTIYNP